MSHFLTYVIVEASKLDGGQLNEAGMARVEKVRADLEDHITRELGVSMSTADAERARATIEDTITNLPMYEALNAELARLLAPYDENVRVDPYERDCHCVDMQAVLDSRKTADEQLGDIRGTFEAKPELVELRRRTRALYGINDDGEHFTPTKEQLADASAAEDQMDALWREHVRPYEAARREAYEAHPLKGKPREDCDECKGTGKKESTYNPKSRWDWWRIGGRYDGLITQADVNSEDNFRFGSQHETPELNTVEGSQLPDDAELRKLLPFAIVTPDGQWHERGKMGWWAMVSDEKEDWPERAIALLSKYRSSAYIVVACDVHI